MKTFAEFCSILLVALITITGAQAIADDDADTPADEDDANIEPGEDSAPADENNANIEPGEDSAPADEDDANIELGEDSAPTDEPDQDSAPADEDDAPVPAAKPGLLSLMFGPLAIGIEGGHGSSETDSWRVVLQSHWHKRWFDKGRWYLTGYWELDYARWETTRTPNPGGVDNLYTFGGTPVFRLMRKRIFGIDTLTYIEGAVGFHWLSNSFIADKNLSAKFQFGDHVGAGIFFGPDDCYELGYRLQHFSNGGLDSPNAGMDFHSFRLVYHF